MSIIKASGAGEVSSGVYKGVVQNSLRLNGSDATLSRTIGSSGGDRQKNVWSFWAKFFDLQGDSGHHYFYSKGDNGPYADVIVIALADHRMQIQGVVDDATTHNVITTRKFRDPTAWYHFVIAIDTTQGTAADRIIVYVNGERETAYDTTTYPSQNAQLAMNFYNTSPGTTVERIGDYQASQNSAYRINGCLAEFHSVDGLSFFSDTSGTANTSFNINSFGETNKGIWIPKAYTGSHGNEGYHLKFDNESVGSGSSSTVGADSSGNNNHWTSNNILATDCNNFDCPENNVCTINAEDRRYGHLADVVGTTTNANLLATTNSSTSNQTHHIGTHTINEVASQGGVYFEFRIVTINAPRLYVGLVATSSFANNSANGAGVASYQFPRKAMLQVGGNYFVHTTNQAGASDDLRTGNTVFSAGEVGGMAILSDGKVFMHREGTYLKNAAGNTGNPSTGDNPIMTLDLTNYKWQPYAGYAASAVHFNFGQDPSFDGNETAPGTDKNDANGIGKFLFDVPTNCLALCSSNMVDPDIIEPKDHFDVLLYTGTGNDNEDISGLSFQPDWVWKKSRTENVRNTLTDSSRGVGKDLFSDLDGQESNDTAGIKAFNSDGFRLGTSTNHNVLNKTYVAWCWKANGGTTTTNDASSTSIGNLDSVIQANTTAGFSIVTYTGQDAATTIAHGLGKKPAWIIVKQRTDNSTEWIVGHHELTSDAFGDSKFLKLEENSSVFTNTAVFNATPTTTAIQLTSSAAANLTAASKDFVAYCFAEIDGFSKFGGYNARSGSGGGDDNEDGTFIFTGFRPAWLMIKYTGSGEWTIRDRARDPDNPTHKVLRANSYGTEQTPYSIDFYANGFKCKQFSGYHDHPAGGDFIYMAFAEQPFKYANAR